MTLKHLIGPLLAATLFALPQAHAQGAQAPAPGASSQASGQVALGHLLFVQRCALCHLSPDGWRKSGLAPSIGPPLTNVMRDGSAEREAFVRERIRQGSTSMPGFQYGLDSRQLDSLIAYLRTLK